MSTISGTTNGAMRVFATGPCRVDVVGHPAGGPWLLHDTAASRAAEAAALAGHAPHALMARAGLAVARLALARFPGRRRVHLLCGPGNNGGDGLVAARHLDALGVPVRAHLVGDTSRTPADARHALDAARAANVPLAPFDAGLEAPAADELVIDALLGLGTRRAPEGALAAAIGWAAGGSAPVLAVDLPSGLHAETGQPLGTACIRATATLSLLTLKPGLFTAQGRDHAGEVWFDGLGVVAGGATAALASPPRWPAPAHASHKGSHGDVIVVGGAAGMVGAAWLAADAALQAGAGRVYLGLLDGSASGFDANRPELMSRREAWLAPAAQLEAATVVCGCGGGDAVAAVLPPLLAHAGRLVLDADALNAIARELPLQALLRARGARGRPTVLTPHPLEAARLLQRTAADVQADRLAAAQALVRQTQAVALLKGSGTVIAAPGAMPIVNPTGNAALATAGSGDVLAGWIAGWWSRWPAAEAQALAAHTAWQHGRAADLHVADGGCVPLRAGRLAAAMAQLR
jgi:hydroxyethylthiazole kinase-like uncharacterized protein yjeF